MTTMPIFACKLRNRTADKNQVGISKEIIIITLKIKPSLELVGLFFLTLSDIFVGFHYGKMPLGA